MGKRLAVLVVVISMMLVVPALAYPRQILRDGDDTRSHLDLKRVVFRYSDGKLSVMMSTYDPWLVSDIATVGRAGDMNFYFGMDTKGDYEGDYYVGVYRDNGRLFAIIRKMTGGDGQIGPKVGKVPAYRKDQRVVFRFGANRVEVQGGKIRWNAYTKDNRTCERECLDTVPNSRPAVYRY